MHVLYREPYQFMLPDYMVHRSYKPKSKNTNNICPPAPSGVPYRNPVIPGREGMYSVNQTAIAFIELCMMGVRYI